VNEWGGIERGSWN